MIRYGYGNIEEDRIIHKSMYKMEEQRHWQEILKSFCEYFTQVATDFNKSTTVESKEYTAAQVRMMVQEEID